MRYEEFASVVTPAYVFATDELCERIEKIRTLLGPGIRLVYAVKANPFLIGALQPLVDALEVCSPGEMRICEELGIPGEKLVLSGVHKDAEEFARIADRYGSSPVYTVESPAQMRLLDRIARERGLTLRVLLRVSSGNQFGVDPDTLRSLLCERESYSALQIRGLQLYSGTQKTAKTIRNEVGFLKELLETTREEAAFSIEELEYGPGLACSYFVNEEEIPVEETIAELRSALSELSFPGQITLEMGRFLVATCGYFATRIVDQKESGGRTWCIVDGGIHHLNYYGQTMAMKVPHMLCKPEGEAVSVAVCGSLCTVADVLVREVDLPDPQPQDLLVFTRVGAYSVTESIGLFLSRDLPRIYQYEEGRLSLLREALPTWRINYGRIAGNP